MQRLADHLNENNLMNSFQSAYTKFNSTETTLLAVHDHIIRAMSHYYYYYYFFFYNPRYYVP